VAAIAGVDFAIELAETVLGQPALALADAWRELEAAQVLRGHAFAHDLVYEATLASVPGPIAARTHGAVAAVLQERGGEPARVAAHWIAAGQASRALAALHAAAAAAQRAMRRKEEAAFLAQAADIEAAAGDRVAEFASRRAMIEALWAADRRALDAASFDRLQASATSDRERGAALVLRANWSYEAGDADDSMRLCRSAIELAERAGDENTAAQARQRLAEILHFRGDFDGAVALLQQLMPWFAANADDLQRVNFHGDFAIALDNANRSREARVHHQLALDLARRIGAWSDAVIILSNLAVSWAGAGFMVRAIGYLREALQLAAAHDEARGCAASLPIEMHNNLRDSGHYADALRWVEPALAAAEGQLAAWLPLVRCHIACGWIHLGQHARAQREVDAALKTAGPEWMRAKALQMRARIRLALGKGARELLEEARAAVPRDGRRMLRLSITLDHTLTMEPKAAWAAARDVIAEAERIELTGTALAGHIRAARFAVDAGLAAEALAHARVISAIGEEVMPLDLFPAERWLNAWRAFRLAGHEAEAAAALRCGVAWVHETSREHVPEPFRDSFARANTINQQLLRASP
jgi:tetratricopeptide (TPR) repeat protein